VGSEAARDTWDHSRVPQSRLGLIVLVRAGKRDGANQGILQSYAEISARTRFRAAWPTLTARCRALLVILDLVL
jgi:hypothetical protein